MTSATPEVPGASDERAGTVDGDDGTAAAGRSAAAEDGTVAAEDGTAAAGDGTAAAEDRCADLMDGIRAGDEEAFEHLFRENGGVMLAVIVRIVRDRSLGEEVLQDCFTEIWQNAGSFNRARGSGRGWLITLCRRRAIDCVRSVQSQRDRDWTQGAEQLGGNAEPAEDTAVARDEAVRTATALHSLGGDQASAIALAYYEDMSHAQISETLDVPLGTVKSRIRDGMTKLRTMLEGGR